MILSSLTIDNIRAIEHAEIHFRPGMNLIVGINGAGKSTILDAIRIMLSQVLPKISASKSQPSYFTAEDVRKNATRSAVELNFITSQVPFRTTSEYTIETETSSVPLSATNILPQHERLYSELKGMNNQPLAVFFSPQRSVLMTKKGKSTLRGGKTFAFANSLDHRGLNLTEMIEWIRYKSVLKKTVLKEAGGEPFKYIYDVNLEEVNEVVSLFLDGCENLRVEEEYPTIKTNKYGQQVEQRSAIRLLLDKNGVTLDVSHLSDGERGILSLVLDLARRLTYANSNTPNPIRDGEAVILIDEIDLHLHPRWQREIVQKLTDTFPKCQFIATTHSPQVIGESPAESMTLLIKEGNNIVTRKATQAFGLDTNWILETMMDTPRRNPKVEKQIFAVEEALEEGDLETARQELERYRKTIKEDDDEAIRLEASIDNLESLADEVDSEED